MWAEDGSASVAAATMVAVLVAVTVGIAGAGAAVAARHRAQAAADLAALAAAGALAGGPQAACARATGIASSMRAELSGCSVENLDVVVTVDVSVNLGRFGLGAARAVARAGPAATGPGAG
ncbi:hypothetical protein MHAS_03855 [Mycolicibacterium hassiacum DSM 44199]|uniref:Rv3654c family TadE-like protein n=1 Tax=Mycolicibacterium hassiacum TaxID=46351 RepID=UPI0002D4F5A7|nr:Rv3654c family TadE-like protein [Mycolicibacterium hassiacum]MBX5488525.1 helicase [Mycolicibacterium hassiacum]PZN20721.1 MAG: helicase [Mycolicibacterium hassiacum]VCT92130.1 hypothetical protein MHAS_03855 [Mycolicibacterium hassiacum DSM 44199]